MPHLSYANLTIVLAVAFAARLALGLFPRVRLPGVVVEIVLGIVVGPQVLGWVKIDELLAGVSFVGLAFVLFLSGLELKVESFRGAALKRSVIETGVSMAIAFAVAGAMSAAGLIDDSLLVAVTLLATSLGLIVPVLKESGHLAKPLGQSVVSSAGFGDIITVIALSLFFSRQGGGSWTRFALVGVFSVAVLVVVLGLRLAERSSRLSDTLRALQDTTAQIRVRGAMVLVVALAFVAQRSGLEAILGAFAAGAIISALDTDMEHTHPLFPVKLEAIGYGFLIPVFFITTGVRFDLKALTSDPSALVLVPIFLSAMLLTRAVPVLFSRDVITTRGGLAAAGLLQATSLPVIVTATALGRETGAISNAAAAAFVAAGLVSALVFPAAALSLLDREK